MKKVVGIILVLLFCFTSGACAIRKHGVLIAGLEDSGAYVMNATLEYTLQNEYTQIGDIDRTYEVVINGENYLGKYVETLISPYYHCDADIYLATVDNNLLVEFWINKATDELVEYSFAYRNGYVIQSDDNSYEDCYLIALRELELRLNGEEFKQTKLDEHPNTVYVPECGNVYSFYFVKMIDNIASNIIVWIDVNTDGLVCLYNAVEEPSLDNTIDHHSIINIINDSETNELIDNKLNSIYGSYDPEEVFWNISKQYISKLRSGSACVQYEIQVSINGNEEKDHLRLLIIP